MCNYVCVLGILATTGPGGQLRRDYSVQNRRSLHRATPDFLLSLVALSIFMRLSLRSRIRLTCATDFNRKSGVA